MIKTIYALLRIRQLLRIEQSAKEVSDEIDAFDRQLNGTPPLYNDARSPNGDDYNVMLSITARLKEDL
jgi:hypothetical protein